MYSGTYKFSSLCACVTCWISDFLFVWEEGQIYLPVEGLYDIIPRVPECLFLRLNCPPPLEPKGGGQHSLAGEGGGGSQFGRLERKPGTLYTLCIYPISNRSFSWIAYVYCIMYMYSTVYTVHWEYSMWNKFMYTQALHIVTIVSEKVQKLITFTTD